MTINEQRNMIGPTPPPSREQLERARRAVCARSNDIEDARMLLAMLGLMD